jgi:hypothetical protein
VTVEEEVDKAAISGESHNVVCVWAGCTPSRILCPCQAVCRIVLSRRCEVPAPTSTTWPPRPLRQSVKSNDDSVCSRPATPATCPFELPSKVDISQQTYSLKYYTLRTEILEQPALLKLMHCRPSVK